MTRLARRGPQPGAAGRHADQPPLRPPPDPGRCRTPVNFTMVAPVVRAMARGPPGRVLFHRQRGTRRGCATSTARRRTCALIDPRRAALMKFDAYVASDFMWASLPRGTRRVQVFHGVGGKYGFDVPDTSMRDWDRLFFVNERRLRNFIAAGAIEPDSPAIRLIGMPKADCLVDGTFDRDAVLLSLGLDPARPTVLYAPTWSPASSLNAMGVELVARAAPAARQPDRQAARPVARSARALLGRRGLGRDAASAPACRAAA